MGNVCKPGGHVCHKFHMFSNMFSHMKFTRAKHFSHGITCDFTHVKPRFFFCKGKKKRGMTKPRKKTETGMEAHLTEEQWPLKKKLIHL